MKEYSFHTLCWHYRWPEDRLMNLKTNWKGKHQSEAAYGAV